ncbi:hypothetical protein CesoFtcFv8_003368 [Champsocephalus esox]|uniref:Uncharacterized protein n=1 Tax=Champsocephalus esox TaxID=159716 RepID=A0AAN8HB45_9TELE|nr:hypothetical protein CesoFtcFv8_003368 [Champsocephalus esox]
MSIPSQLRRGTFKVTKKASDCAPSYRALRCVPWCVLSCASPNVLERNEEISKLREETRANVVPPGFPTPAFVLPSPLS